MAAKRPRPIRAVTTGAVCAVTIVGLAGCTSLKQVSIHDPELASAALQAQSAWASAGSGDVWTTMLDNLERSAVVERDALAAVMALRFEGQLQDVETLTWAGVAACATGKCGASSTEQAIELTGETDLAANFDLQGTSEKIAETAAEMAAIGEEIAALSRLMATDPSGASATGELSPPPTSVVADAIASAETGIATLEKRLDAVKREKIARLEEAISGVLPRLPPELSARREAIRTALTGGIERLRGALEAVSFNAFTTAATTESEALLMAAGITPDGETKRLLTRAIRNAFDDFFEPLETHSAATEEVLTEADALVAAALGEGTPSSERVAAITDVLRKAEHLDVLKPDTLAEVLEGAANKQLSGDVARALGVANVQQLLELIEKRGQRIEALADEVSIAQLFEEFRSEPLSDEFKTALNGHTGQEIKSVGALLDYLKTDQSRLQEVRVSLMADWRRAVVEGRALELESLRHRLALTEKRGRALAAQRLAEEGFGLQLQAIGACLPGLALESRAVVTLRELARGTPLRLTESDDCSEEHYGDERRQFENLVGVLSDYFNRIGHLHDSERLAHYELIRYEHRRSIDASRLAAAAHEQLIKNGLQGLVAFTQGGLTTEQVATVLRFLNAGLLNVIANEE